MYASGLLVARTAAGTTSYLHQDPLGSVRATSDTVGNWAYVTQYKPFGQEYATSGSYARLKYTGQWRDANTDLYYLYRMFYDPDLGRFLSPDPVVGTSHCRSPWTGTSARSRRQPPFDSWSSSCGTIARTTDGADIRRVTRRRLDRGLRPSASAARFNKLLMEIRGQVVPGGHELSE